MSDELPWSHLIEVAAIPAQGQSVELVPDEGTRKRLAETANVAAVLPLKAKFELRPMADGGVKVTGSLEGQVRQTCVVSLEDFDAPIAETIAVDFTSDLKSGDETDDEADVPDQIVDGKIDLGALATEFLILGVDPYPRKAGVEFTPAVAEETATEVKRSPFEQLSGLKDRIKK